MNFKKFGNFNWIEMDSKDQNLDLTRTKRIYLYPFQSVFVCWAPKIERYFRMRRTARRDEPIPAAAEEPPSIGSANGIAIAILRRFSRRCFVSFRMSHSAGERRARGSLFDALSRVIGARRDTKGFVYRKIRPTMASERDDIGDLSDVILQENSDAETQVRLFGRRWTPGD